MKNKQSIKIQFPSLLLMPFIAVIASICKICGASYSWLNAVLVIPISLYFLWCVGYVILAILAILLHKVLKGSK